MNTIWSAARKCRFLFDAERRIHMLGTSRKCPRSARKTKRQSHAALQIALLALATLAHADAPEAADHTIAHALESFHLADDALTIELVAAEPDVIDPVAIVWDEAGRLYVAEMRDYPTGPTAGTVRLLEDTDADGRYEKVTLFAEGLPFPNSVMPWRGGVFVSAAPDILYLKDTDGDGKADERRVVLTGFAEGNQQLRVNSLHLGLDGWVYAANGRSDGVVRHPEDPADKAVPLRRHDLRFHPDTFAFEPISGFSQFGLCHDDWGNRFLSWNTVPIRHVVLEESVLARNPLLATTTVEAVITDPTDTGRIYPIAQPVPRFNRESVDFFNASCGLTIYRGDQLPGLRGDALLCEPLSSLVHHKRLTPQGATFVAKRVEQDKEFLASTTPWFRPVNLATGPDGNLYVVDFARKWVEHPDFVPKEYRDTTDWRTGDSLGRIWRIRRRTAVVPTAHLSPTTPDLVEALNHANAWLRDTAQRLLIERNDPAARPLLEHLALKATYPYTRVQALHTLDILGWHAEEILERAATYHDAEMRRQAAVFAPRWTSDEKALRQILLLLAGDPSERVRFQALLSSAALDRALRTAVILRVCEKPGDSWINTAILCNASDNAGEVLTKLLAATALSPEDRNPNLQSGAGGTPALLGGLAEIIGATNSANETTPLIASLSTLPADTAAPIVAGLFRGLERVKADTRALSEDPALRALLEPHIVDAINLETGDVHRRLEAMELYRRGLALSADQAVSERVLATASEPLRIAAVNALAARLGPQVLSERFLDNPATTAATRRAILAACLSSPAGVTALLDALEGGKISAPEIDPQTRETLAHYPDAALKARAEQLLGNPAAADRAEIVNAYAASLSLPANAPRGAELFAQNCMPCHVHQGKGNRVGPDLSGIASRPREQLLADILNPSLEIVPDFVCYTATISGLDIVTGVLAGETTIAITLRQAQGIEQSIPRADLTDFRASPLSLMPTGFESTLDPQAMADLLAFLHPATPR